MRSPLSAERLQQPEPGQVPPVVVRRPPAQPQRGTVEGPGRFAAKAPAVGGKSGSAPQISYCLQGLEAPNNGRPLSQGKTCKSSRTPA